MTTRQDIKGWIDRGIKNGTKWMIVVCDSFSYEDYPVFADTVEDFDAKYASYNGVNMQRIMEVYDLEADLESQLNQRRSYAYPALSRFNPDKKNRITATRKENNSNPLLDWVDKK